MVARLDPQIAQCAALGRSPPRVGAGGADPGAPDFLAAAGPHQDGWTTRAKFDEAQQKLLCAEAQVNSAQAQVRTAQDQQSYTVLSADAPGAVTATGADRAKSSTPGRRWCRSRIRAGNAVFDVPEQLIRTGPRRPPGRPRSHQRPTGEGDRPGAGSFAPGGCRDADISSESQDHRSAGSDAAGRPFPAASNSPRPPGRGSGERAHPGGRTPRRVGGRPAEPDRLSAQHGGPALRPAAIVISRAGNRRARCHRRRADIASRPESPPPGSRVMNLQPLRMGDPAPFAGDLFHARHRGGGHRILFPARAQRRSGLHRQDHGGQAAMAGRHGQRHARADHRPYREQAPGDAEPRLSEELHERGPGHGLRQPEGSDPTAQVPDIWYQVRKKVDDIRNTAAGMSGPASMTSSATPTASFTALPQTVSLIGELRDYVDDVRKRAPRAAGHLEDRHSRRARTSELRGVLDRATRRPRDRPRRADRRAAAPRTRVSRRRVQTGDEKILVRVSGTFRSAHDILAVNFAVNGRTIRLGDIAQRHAAAPPIPPNRCSASTATRHRARHRHAQRRRRPGSRAQRRARHGRDHREPACRNRADLVADQPVTSSTPSTSSWRRCGRPSRSSLG